MNYTSDEKNLVTELCKLLSGEFDITNESQLKKIPGKFSLDGESFSMIPDLLLRPKEHLLNEIKFWDTIIPVEVKYIDHVDCNKFEDLMCQCHSYRFSSFQGIYPKLCLYYIGGSFEKVKYDYE